MENHAALAERLRAAGHAYVSGTDTEVLAHLDRGAPRRGDGPAGRGARPPCARSTGTFSIAVVDAATPGQIVAARRVSPLIVGRGDGVTYLASDIPAILERTRDLVAVEDDQLAVLTAGGLELFDLDGTPVVPTSSGRLGRRDRAAGRPPRLHDQGDLRAARGRARDAARRVAIPPGSDRRSTSCSSADEALAAIDRVVLVACGSSYHAALVGKYAIERWARIGCEVDIASEFRYREPVLDERTLVIGVSQSGETDRHPPGAARRAGQGGARVVTVCNVVDASMAREADAVVYTRAGREICVAVDEDGARPDRGAPAAGAAPRPGAAPRCRRPTSRRPSTDSPRPAELVAATLKRADHVAEVAEGLHGARDFFFIGRHVGFPVALEGALKLKELSYLHAEGYPAGELKHGPIALIEPGTVVVAVITDDALRDKVVSNVAEVKARGASVVVARTARTTRRPRRSATGRSACPHTDAARRARCSRSSPLQLLAYHLARLRGLNVDRPRNLAKTVTVE